MTTTDTATANHTGIAVDAAYWRARLAALLTKYRVPGATLGILHDGRIIDVAAGVLSRTTLVEATPDSVFQIGSISKVWTATLIMQLVDEGRLTLDTPVRQILPEFGAGDPEIAKTITAWHLLTHTSGIDGDVFFDTGRGDDCIEVYVARLEEMAAQTHPPGATFSYCNSGFVAAGRIVEVLTGKVWDAALRERIIEPLGLAGTVTLPEEAILHRAAVGHVTESGAESHPTAQWTLPRNSGPAGLITARVQDVLDFARMHLHSGVAPDGTRVLSEESARAMTEPQVELPDAAGKGDSCGLGWIRFNWDGHRLIGHDGRTVGQTAFLRVLPEQNFAVSLLTNGGDAGGLYQELYADIFRDLAGVTMAAPFGPPSEPVAIDLSPYVGKYSRAGFGLDVTERDGTLVLRMTITGPLADLFPTPKEQPLTPVAVNHFATRSEGSAVWESVRFYTLPDGSRYLHYGFRAYPAHRC